MEDVDRNREEELQIYEETALHWRRGGKFFTLLHFVCGLGAIILSSLGPLLQGYAQGAMIAAAGGSLLTSILTFASAKESGNAHTRGFRALKIEIARCRTNKTRGTDRLRELLQKHERDIQEHTF